MELVFWTAVLAIATSIMAAAIIITAIYAAVQLRHIKKARYSTLLMQLLQTWDSGDYVKSRELISHCFTGTNDQECRDNLLKDFKNFERTTSAEFFVIVRLANFFENLGYLVCQGHLDKKQAIPIFGDTAQAYWNKLEGSINYYRTGVGTALPMVWIYFEYLAGGCKGKKPIIKIK